MEHIVVKGLDRKALCRRVGRSFSSTAAISTVSTICACTTSDASPAAAELRQALVGLSGRQVKRGKAARPFTEPALLAGLELLLKMVTVLERHDAADLRRLLEAALPGLLRPRPPNDV